MKISTLPQDLLSGVGILALTAGLGLMMVNPALAHFNNCATGGCLQKADNSCAVPGACNPPVNACGCANTIEIDPTTGQEFLDCPCDPS